MQTDCFSVANHCLSLVFMVTDFFCEIIMNSSYSVIILISQTCPYCMNKTRSPVAVYVTESRMIIEKSATISFQAKGTKGNFSNWL